MLKKYLLHMLFLGSLLCLLAACATSPAPSQPSVHATAMPPTATTLPAGTLLYQANWLHGLTGWPNTHGWKVVHGQLESNDSEMTTLTIPSRPTVPNYVIEYRMQIVSAEAFFPLPRSVHSVYCK